MGKGYEELKEVASFLTSMAWCKVPEATHSDDTSKTYAQEQPQGITWVALMALYHIHGGAKTDDLNTRWAAIANKPVLERTALETQQMGEIHQAINRQSPTLQTQLNEFKARVMKVVH